MDCTSDDARCYSCGPTNVTRAPLVRASAVAFRAVAALIFASIVVSAWHDVSQAWDSGYYHLPFAARLGGVIGPDSYVFAAANQARFEGFPLLGELLQGLLWRITGRIECASFVAVASVPLFAWFLRRRFDVPMSLSMIALFAIPLVQTHATSCYVDLPANAAASVVVLIAIEAVSTTREISMRVLAVVCTCAAIAANMKALLHIILLLALLVIAWRLFQQSARKKLIVLALAAPIIFATPLKNLVLHHNPYFPLKLTIAGQVFPGVEEPYSSSPPWLASAPRPARFVCSLLEIKIRPFTDERRWTVDQWMPESSGSRMGGFFSVYVVLNLVLLMWKALRDREGTARRASVAFLAFTLVVSLMPQSHELRYYLSWMMVLVALNAWLVCRPAPAEIKLDRAMYGSFVTASLLCVVLVTRADYVMPSGSSLAQLLDKKVDERALATVHDGARVCVDRAPWTLYYAAPFHPPRHYAVQEAETPADCSGAPRL